MQFRTELSLPSAEFSCRYGENMLALGSCFAENIGQQLFRLKYKVEVNPFGTLYNPISIRNSLALLINNYEFKEDDLFSYNDLWHSFQHHSRFSGSDKELVLEKINARLLSARALMPELKYLFITLGTAWIYQIKGTTQVVSNCHKLPDKYFDRKRLSPDEITEQLEAILLYLQQIHPNIKIILSVSPIRHLKDGFFENQLSKSTLLLAVHQLRERLTSIDYFPAYELLIDDLRDYRFYNDDLVHPSNQAIEYIWEKFEGRYLADVDRNLRSRVEKLQKSLAHRPFNPNSPQYQHHLERVTAAMNDLEKEFKTLDFTYERKRMR